MLRILPPAGLNPLEDCSDSFAWFAFGTYAASIIGGLNVGVARNVTIHSGETKFLFKMWLGRQTFAAPVSQWRGKCTGRVAGGSLRKRRSGRGAAPAPHSAAARAAARAGMPCRTSLCMWCLQHASSAIPSPARPPCDACCAPGQQLHELPGPAPPVLQCGIRAAV